MKKWLLAGSLIVVASFGCLYLAFVTSDPTHSPVEQVKSLTFADLETGEDLDVLVDASFVGKQPGEKVTVKVNGEERVFVIGENAFGDIQKALDATETQ